MATSKKSFAHPSLLTALDGTPKRHDLVIVDIESKARGSSEAGFERPFLVGVFDGATFCRYRDRESRPDGRPRNPKTIDDHRYLSDGGCMDAAMRALLSAENVGKSIFAHNGGRFDHLFAVSWLLRHREEYDVEIIPTQSKLQVLDVRAREHRKGKKGEKRGRPRWRFLDSVGLLPMSLEEAGRAFGLGGKDDLDWDTHEDDPRWEVYNERDCRLLYLVLKKFHDLVEELGGQVGITSPATAMDLFRRRYMGSGLAPKEIPRHPHFRNCPCPKGDKGRPLPGEKCLHAFIRQSYHGGRTEVFQASGKNLKYYDRNSSYPASMMHPQPVGSRIETRSISVSRMRALDADGYIGFVDCDVYIPMDVYLPPLPIVSAPPDKKLVFPVGRLSGVFHWEELKRALMCHENAEIVRVRRSVWYQGAPIFRSFVEDLYAKRNKTLENYNEGLAAVAKLMLNSCYGKFGMREERERIILHPPDAPSMFPGVGYTPMSPDDDCPVWYKTEVTDARYIVPQIASHITALSRCALWDMAVMALSLGGKLYYCDTDSIITDVLLPEGPNLGQWKDEHPNAVLSGDFFGAKQYALHNITTGGAAFKGCHRGDCPAHPKNKSRRRTSEEKSECRGCSTTKYVAKGIPSSLHTPESMAALARGEVIEFPRLSQVRSLLRNTVILGKTGPELSAAKKSVRSQYDKRILYPDGSTEPWPISMWD